MTPRDRTLEKARLLYRHMHEVSTNEMGEFEYAQAALFQLSVECLERFLDAIADEEGTL